MKYALSLLFALLVSFSNIALAAGVNINTADSATLTKELTGIGEAKAQAIIDYRTKNGPFKSVDELSMVSGIGEATLEKNRANLIVE